MGNKEINKAIPVELDDDALDNVSGGTEPSQDEEIIGGMPSFPPSEHMIELQLQIEYKEDDEKGSN